MQFFFSELKLKLNNYKDSEKILSSSFINKNNCKYYIFPKRFKRAAVLCLIETNKKGLNILLTLRSKQLSNHPGQISFPGGKVNDEESLYDCALRETEEEIGLKNKNINILGELDMYLSGSNFLIKPVIGCINKNYKISLNKEEVEKVIYFPIKHLFKKENFKSKFYIDNNKNKKMFYYDINWKNHRIWGTTAIILVHLSKIISSVV